MCVCMCVNVYESEHDSVLTVYSINLKFGMYIIGHRQTNSIVFGECWMLSVFTGEQKKSSYTLQAK